MTTLSIPTFPSPEEVIAELIPIGSLWKRTRGKHANRTVQVAAITNRSIKIRLVGRQYSNAKIRGSGQHEAQVPFDEFTSLYITEDSAAVLPTYDS